MRSPNRFKRPSKRASRSSYSPASNTSMSPRSNERASVTVTSSLGGSATVDGGTGLARALGDSAIVSVHCHDDLGLAVANSLAAVQAGARQVECTINGIGERAGNASLEEVVMGLRHLYGIETGINTQRLCEVSQLVTTISGRMIAPNKCIVGSAVFTHESGIHVDGLLDWYLGLPAVGGPSLSVSATGIFLVFVYIWSPYMILPVETALERVPRSLVEASGDLGANAAQTFRNVILPLALPGVVAGSIFTFSLTLGDFIVPALFGNSSYFIGKAVLTYQATSGNIPLAAAFTMGPIVIMIIYLLIARRLGAFDAL